MRRKSLEGTDDRRLSGTALRLRGTDGSRISGASGMENRWWMERKMQPDPSGIQEMQTTLNQMETGNERSAPTGSLGGGSESSYMKFASLLGNSVSYGGKGSETASRGMEAAFHRRKDLALRKGRRHPRSFLIPMFLMLGIVMIMVVAPAFYHCRDEMDRRMQDCRWIEYFDGVSGKTRQENRKTLEHMGGVCMQLKRFLMEEDGVGVIEVVLILVVLIGLVIVFQDSDQQAVDGIFTEINKQAKERYIR